jgi:hypothetical protein
MKPIVHASISALLLLASAPAHAALPPYAQSVREIEAIINDRAVADALQGNMIDRIETVAVDRLRVSAGACHADVHLKSLPRENPGPRLFTVGLSDQCCTAAATPAP